MKAQNAIQHHLSLCGCAISWGNFYKSHFRQVWGFRVQQTRLYHIWPWLRPKPLDFLNTHLKKLSILNFYFSEMSNMESKMRNMITKLDNLGTRIPKLDYLNFGGNQAAQKEQNTFEWTTSIRSAKGKINFLSKFAWRIWRNYLKSWLSRL